MYLKKRKRLISRGEGGRRQATQSSLSVWVSPCGKMSTSKTIPNGADNKWLRHPLPFHLYQSLHKKNTRWYPFQFQPLICFSDKACQRMRILEKCTKCNTQNHPFSRITLKIQPRAEQHRPPPTFISCPNRFLRISSLTKVWLILAAGMFANANSLEVRELCASTGTAYFEKGKRNASKS